MKSAFVFLSKTFKTFSKDHVPQLAAALSYYAIFSLGPLLILLISALGFFLKSEEAQTTILSFLEKSVGSDSAETISAMMETVNQTQGSFIINVVGILLLIIAATGLFNQLQFALNQIWGVRVKPGGTIKNLIHQRLSSFTLIIAIGSLVIASLFLSTTLSFSIRFLSKAFPFALYLLPLTELLLSLGIMSLLFTYLFRSLPDVQLKWQHVWRGGLFTGGLFFIGKIGLSWYFTSGGGTSSYGAAGAFIAILLWAYYSSLILLLGAEFTKIWLVEKKIKISPKEFATKDKQCD